jgi:methylase of polypeptide subunit release factors
MSAASFSLGDKPFRDDLAVDLAPLRAALREAVYTSDVLFESVGLPRTGGRLELPVALRRTSTPTRMHTLARLFLLGRAVPVEQAQSALAPMPVEPLVALGLLHERDGGLQSVATIVPYGELFLVHDHGPEVTEGRLAHDHVVGAGQSSLKLAALTPRPVVGSALDLGCGSGVQAVRLAHHARQVVGTDLNPRALSFTRMTARLNGLDNIETRLGSLFEPVAGETFDLVVSNPPFALSPQCDYLYRDSGATGDALAQQVIGQLPKLLAPGGWGVIMFSWTHDGPEDWPERPRRWTEGRGVDAWLLKFETQDALGYAVPWLTAPGATTGTTFAEKLDEWTAYYERLGIRYVTIGTMVVRRRSAAANFFRASDLGGWGDLEDCGPQIERVFANQAILNSLADDDALLQLAPTLAPEHELVHAQCAQNGQWTTLRAQLLLAHGLRFAGNIDPVIGRLLANCDGSRTVGALVAGFCRQANLNPEALARPVAAVFRKLLENGLLELPALKTTAASTPQPGQQDVG